MQRNLVLLMCLGLTTYFGTHAIQGRHGLEARSRLIERSRMLERDIRALETVRARLEREINLLSDGTADADFVDELARRTLGLALPRDRLMIEPSR